MTRAARAAWGGLASLGIRSVPLGLALAALGFFNVAGPDLGVAIGAAGTGVAVVLEVVGRGGWRSLGAWAALGTLLVVSGSAVPSVPAELLGGLGGLAVLAWFAAPSDPGRAGRRLEGLALPGLAVGIAFAAAVFLPAAPGLAAVAFALVALVVLAVAWAVGRPGRLGVGTTPS